METINYKMLTLAREARGYTQSELVSKIYKLSQGNYSRMEKGILPIPNDLLGKLSEVLDFPVGFFYRDTPLVTQSEYFYRKKAALPKKELYKLEAQFDLIRLWFNELLNEVEITDSSFPEILVGLNNTPEIIAQKTRAYIQAPKGPMIDLVNLLERNGIILYFLHDAPEKFDGTTIITDSNHKVIVLNASMPNYRKRFTIAHELGHIIMHIPFAVFLEEYADVENEANRFASELLMPEAEISRDLQYLTYGKLSDLKQYWKVSKSALIRRGYTLGYLRPEKYQSLMIELSRYNERKKEATDVTLDEPRLFDKIIKTFLNHLNYSMDELKAFLGLNSDDFNSSILKNERAVHKMRVFV
jgi:Zn-dependent peptidase ImmA (M78 family)